MDSHGANYPSTRGSRKATPSTESSEGEEPDEPTSSHPPMDDELQHFREKWQKELRIGPTKVVTRKKYAPPISQPLDVELTTENEARTLFLKGVDMEKSGELYEAIKFYRKAIQLVPDIEFKLHKVAKTSKQPGDGYREAAAMKAASSESEDDVRETDLLSRIQRKMSKTSSICTPKSDQKTTHISDLPVEIVLYILRWVVSSELDLRSLEMFGRVCRGFYLCARDAEIWRLACLKVWGVHCGKTAGIYGNWRQMFVDRARLRFNGCYISKTTYIRHGENSFQDQFYKPWHLVAYYRYFRFFPEGIVLMLTTPDEPAQCVAQLRHRNARSPVLSGYYRLKDDKVTLVVHRQDNMVPQNFKRRRWEPHDNCEQSFHMELQIMNQRRKRHVQLVWTHYSVKTRARGDESVCNFDLVNNKFPPLWFSRVKSYAVESETPLI